MTAVYAPAPAEGTRHLDQTFSDTRLRLTSYAGLTVAVALTAIRLAAWLATGSVSMLTSAVDALVDSAASVVAFWAWLCQPTAGPQAPLGHGKAEAVAGFAQANPWPVPPACSPSSPSSAVLAANARPPGFRRLGDRPVPRRHRRTRHAAGLGGEAYQLRRHRRRPRPLHG